MRKTLLFVGFFVLGALASIYSTNSNHRENLTLNKNVVRLSAMQSLKDAEGRPGKTSQVLSKKARLESVKDSPLDEDSFNELIYSTNRMNLMATEAMVQRLRANNPTRVAALFIQELEALGSEDPEARAQLVFAANRLQADELLPFWTDLALRTTPRSENEAEVLGLTELTVDAKVIHGEMATAIRNLGLIGYRNSKARAVLEQLVLHPQPLSHPTFVREYAFHALKEADEGAVLRILRGLPLTDPLRLSLKSAVSAR